MLIYLNIIIPVNILAFYLLAGSDAVLNFKEDETLRFAFPLACIIAMLHLFANFPKQNNYG